MRKKITMDLRNIRRYCLYLAERSATNISGGLLSRKEYSLVKDQSKASCKALRTAMKEKVQTYFVRGIEEMLD